MGVYTTGADVFGLLLDHGIGPTARMSEADVEEIIVGLEAQVNGALIAQGYSTVPATGDDDKAMIGQMVRKKAAVQTYLALNQPSRSPDWCRSWDIDWDDWLKALRSGEMNLVNQEPVASQAGQVKVFRLRVLPKVD